MLSFIRSVLSPMAVGIYSNISSIKLYIRSFIRSEMGTLLIMDEKQSSIGCWAAYRLEKTSLMDNRRASLRGCHSFVRSLLWWDGTDYG